MTERGHTPATANMSTAEGERRTPCCISAIESESNKATGLRSDVLLYQGGQYNLIAIRHTDCAPCFCAEFQAAFLEATRITSIFPDSNIDMARPRLRNGQPVNVENYLSV